MAKRCYLCGGKKFVLKNKKTRDNRKVSILQCFRCSLTLLDSFEHLKKISYERGDMHEAVARNQREYRQLLRGLRKDDLRRFNQWKKIIKNKSLLDFGCGAGGFLKLAKKITKKAEGVELDNIARFYNKEIEVKKNINDFKEKFDVITLFHVLEHLPDPIGFLKNLKKYLKTRGLVIVEAPNDDDALISYYQSQAFKDFTYWSLHLYSYNKKTLNMICRRAVFKSVKIGFFQRYSLANHVGWLKDGKPGGHNIYWELNDEKLNELYQKQLEKINGCDTLIAVLKT